MFNTSKELGYDKEVDLSEYLNDTILEKLDKYEPLIRLLERGTVFLYKERGIMIPNVSLHPLHGWYERYLDVEPIDINDI